MRFAATGVIAILQNFKGHGAHIRHVLLSRKSRIFYPVCWGGREGEVATVQGGQQKETVYLVIGVRF